MTCVVGLVDQGRVWMGGDSAGVAGWDLEVRRDPKVFRRGPFLIGYTTSFRMGQLLQFSLDVPDHPEGMDPYEYMVRYFVDAARRCFKDGGYAEKKNEVESAGNYLVGYRGRIFELEGSYQVGESVAGFAAVGCGDQVAKGALFATPHLNPRPRVRQALRAAERFSAGVRGPFTIRSMDARF